MKNHTSPNRYEIHAYRFQFGWVPVATAESLASAVALAKSIGTSLSPDGPFQHDLRCWIVDTAEPTAGPYNWAFILAESAPRLSPAVTGNK